MGVKGLEGLIDQNPVCGKQVEWVVRQGSTDIERALKPVFIVDGYGLLHNLYPIRGRWKAAGGYDRFAHQCRDFFTNLAKVASEVIVVFDGRSPPMKEATRTHRMSQIYETCTKMFAYITRPGHRNPPKSSGHVVPQAVRPWLCEFLHRLHTSQVLAAPLTVRQCMLEADQYIALLARDIQRSRVSQGASSDGHHAVILAKDSDFFVFDNPLYVPLHTLMVDEARVSGTAYEPRNIWKRLGLTHPEVAVWASVAGNDYVDHSSQRPSRKKGRGKKAAQTCKLHPSASKRQQALCNTASRIHRLSREHTPLIHSAAGLEQQAADVILASIEQLTNAACGKQHDVETATKSAMQYAGYHSIEITASSLPPDQGAESLPVSSPRHHGSMPFVDWGKPADPTCCSFCKCATVLPLAIAAQVEEVVAQPSAGSDSHEMCGRLRWTPIIADDGGHRVHRGLQPVVAAHLSVSACLASDIAATQLTLQCLQYNSTGVKCDTIMDSTSIPLWNSSGKPGNTKLGSLCSMLQVPYPEHLTAPNGELDTADTLFLERFLVHVFSSLHAAEFRDSQDVLILLLGWAHHKPVGEAHLELLELSDTTVRFTSAAWTTFILWTAVVEEVIKLLTVCQVIDSLSAMLGACDGHRYYVVIKQPARLPPEAHATADLLRQR
eukprot:m.253096 g.253096  ORF g.253096 m.253096 type:complete len:664 (-) comp15479_c0_seq7:2289-4280(-)